MLVAALVSIRTRSFEVIFLDLFLPRPLPAGDLATYLAAARGGRAKHQGARSGRPSREMAART